MSGKRANGDGTVFSTIRPDGIRVWFAEITLGHTPSGRPRRTRRAARTRTEANALLRRLQAEKLQGRATQIRSDTVLDYGLDWVKNVKSLQVKATTAADYEDRLRRAIAPRLGHVRLIDLTARHIEQWMADLRASGLSAQTVNGARQVLNGICKHAVRGQVIPFNPVTNTDPVKKLAGDGTRVKRPWTREEAGRVLEAAVDSDALDAFLHIMLSIGLRPGEALGLRWSDIDLDARRLSVTGTLKQDRRILPDGRGIVSLTRNTPKTADSARTLPIRDGLHAALVRQQMRQSAARMMVEGWQDTDYVVTTIVGTPVSASNLRRQYRKFLATIGVRYIRLHDIRHTVAVLSLNDADVPLEKVSQALGHERLDTTKRIYARQVPRYNDDFAAGMAAILPQAPRPAQERIADVTPLAPDGGSA